MDKHTFYKTYTAGIITGLMFVVVPIQAFAATLFLVPQRSTVGLHDTLVVDVRVDSGGVGFNATQATIHFPKELLVATDPDIKTSAFNFWIQQPLVSNDKGTISFIGGSAYGVSGGSIQIARLTFTPKGAGAATLSISDAAISSSDGKGSNILSTTTDTTITVSSARTVAATPAPAPTPVVTQVVRTPSAASALPKLPEISIPFYPDGSAWYGIVSPFAVSWNLPSDISGVNSAINHDPNFVLSAASIGVFDSENFSALSDGVWYLHVRFKNSMGWGPTLHRRIAIDTVPPIGFKVTQNGSTDLTDPRATLNFKTSDALSGLQGYQVRVDNSASPLIMASSSPASFTTQPLTPGDHNVQVQALDMAGNGVVSAISVHVNPIKAPVITFVPVQLFLSNNEGPTIEGTARSNEEVLISLVQDGSEVESGVSVADAFGTWSFTSGTVLSAGNLEIHVRSQDARGAMSDEVISPQISVGERPVMQIGSLSVGFQGAIVLMLLLILLLVLVCVFVWRWVRRSHRTFTGTLACLAETDLANVFASERADLNILRKMAAMTAGAKRLINRMYKNNENAEVLLREEIKNIAK